MLWRDGGFRGGRKVLAGVHSSSVSIFFSKQTVSSGDTVLVRKGRATLSVYDTVLLYILCQSTFLQNSVPVVGCSSSVN